MWVSNFTNLFIPGTPCWLVEFCGTVVMICSICFHNERQTIPYSKSNQIKSNQDRAQMKILGISIARTAANLNDPVPLSTANDLTSSGFFQRQVSLGHCPSTRFSVIVRVQIILADTSHSHGSHSQHALNAPFSHT